MKLKVKIEYFDKYGNREFVVGEVLKVKDGDVVPTSDYYHLWDGTQLSLIPKRNCEIVSK